MFFIREGEGVYSAPFFMIFPFSSRLGFPIEKRNVAGGEGRRGCGCRKNGIRSGGRCFRHVACAFDVLMDGIRGPLKGMMKPWACPAGKW